MSTISKTVNVTISKEKIKEAPKNGWDLTKAFVTANGTSYELEMYSFYKYDDIGIKKSKNGKIKCFCSNIV